MCSDEALAEDVLDDLVGLVVRVFEFLCGEVAQFGGDRVGAGTMGVLGGDGAEEHGYGYTCPMDELWICFY